MVEPLIEHVPFVNNHVDICTNALPGEQKCNHLIDLLLHVYPIILLAEEVCESRRFLGYMDNHIHCQMDARSCHIIATPFVCHLFEKTEKNHVYCKYHSRCPHSPVIPIFVLNHK
jgi:hypothetical protein